MFTLVPSLVTYTATKIRLEVGAFALGASEFPVVYTIFNQADKAIETGTKLVPIQFIGLAADPAAHPQAINALLAEWGLEIDWPEAS